MVLELLERLNPWWWGGEDPHVKRWRGQEYRWMPGWIKKLSVKPFSLNFVMGPRLVGKTTGIKLFIKSLLSRVKPEKILYISCEIFPDYMLLARALSGYLEEEGRGNEVVYIFLDEATALRWWWKAVKPLIDAGLAENAVITVTGSSALKVQRDVELFPGRRGYGVTLEVMPLSFSQYVEIHGLEKPRLHVGEVRRLFAKYLESGGFPPSINRQPVEEILSAYIGEIVRHGRSLEIAREVMSALISSAPSPVSYRALASKTSGHSYKVVQSYLELFQGLYLLGAAYLREGEKVWYRREKKFFFRDPLLLKLFSAWTGTRYLDSAVYEHVVQEHVYRKYGEVYYYRDAYEIDVVAGKLKIEVKAGKPHRRYPRGVRVVDKEQIPFFLLELSG